jgi:SAM-dependent methyltransferase
MTTTLGFIHARSVEAGPAAPSLRAFYEDGGRRFRQVPESDPIERIRVNLVFRLMPRSPGISALDVGCGDGYLCEQLSARRFRTVVGADLAASRIAYARSRYPTMPLVQANACELPFDDRQFDMVTCVEVLEHLPDPEQALIEMARVSRRYLICTTPYREDVRESYCPHCDRSFPPAGHLTSFDEERFHRMARQAGLRLLTWRHTHPLLEYRRFRYCPPLKWLIQGYYRKSGFLGGLFVRA